MRNIYLLITFISLIGTLPAQVVTKGVAILNGGRFGNNTENAHLIWHTPSDGNFQTLDTIQTQSIQDIIVNGHLAYVAAQDSIVVYDMANGTRMAANTFGAPSTISMALWEDYLIVGNWFAPFGWVGPYENHLRIFDRHTLAFVDSIPEIKRGAKDLAVIGDTLYVSQNLNSSAFTDSAGWVAKVYLPTLTYADSVVVNSNQEDVGRLFVKDDMLFSLNGGSNTVSQYDPMTGMASTDTANANLNTGSYTDTWAMDENGTFYAILDGKIGTYDPVSRSVVNGNLVDTAIVSFALDSISDRIYLTQTDFNTYTGGQVWAADGSGKLDTLFTGSAPEAIQVMYNTLPVANNDTATTNSNTSVKIALTDNDIDPDPNNVFSVSVLVDVTKGSTQVSNDTLIYTPDLLSWISSGFDSVQYEIADAWGDKDTAWAFINVSSFIGTEELLAEGYNLFPNPSNGQLRIQQKEAQPFSVQLMNLQGQTLQHGETRMGTIDWNLNRLPTGIYLVQIDGPSGRVVTRWQKQ
ncbi:MAG: T9SS type A sorting domain-containing protein [Bacteroidota bacterium]